MGGSGARLRAGGSTANVSPTSTGGKIVNNGNGSYWGENDNGYGVSILDGGRDDINMYRYGSSQIYEVKQYTPDGTQVGQTKYVPTKAEATQIAKKFLNEHK